MQACSSLRHRLGQEERPCNSARGPCRLKLVWVHSGEQAEKSAGGQSLQMRQTHPMTASEAATANATALHRRLKECNATRQTRKKNFRTLLTSSTAEAGRTQPRENHLFVGLKVSMHSRAHKNHLCGKSARWPSHAHSVHSSGAMRAQRHSQRVHTCVHRARSSDLRTCSA